jgi:hypothetical protein
MPPKRSGAARRRRRTRRPEAPDLFSSLPLDVISTHILRSDFLPETADLGRLRAVSKRMRDAVDATGREIKKLSNLRSRGPRVPELAEGQAHARASVLLLGRRNAFLRATRGLASGVLG